MPMPQRTCRQQRAPVRILERRKRQTERRMATAGVPGTGGIQTREARIQFRPCAHEQYLSLEIRETKSCAKNVERRSRALRRGILLGLSVGSCRMFFPRILIFRDREKLHQRNPHFRKRSREPRLVGLVPTSVGVAFIRSSPSDQTSNSKDQNAREE